MAAHAAAPKHEVARPPKIRPVPDVPRPCEQRLWTVIDHRTAHMNITAHPRIIKASIAGAALAAAIGAGAPGSALAQVATRPTGLLCSTYNAQNGTDIARLGWDNAGVTIEDITRAGRQGRHRRAGSRRSAGPRGAAGPGGQGRGCERDPGHGVGGLL